MSCYSAGSVLFTRDSWKLQSRRTSSISIFHQISPHPSPQVHPILLDLVVSTTIGCGFPLLSRRSGSEPKCIGSTSSSRIESITLTPSRLCFEGFICGSGCPSTNASCISSNGPALSQPWVNLASDFSGNPLRPPALTPTLLNHLGNLLRHPPSIPPPVKLQTSASKVYKSRVRGAPQFLTRMLELETCRLPCLCLYCVSSIPTVVGSPIPFAPPPPLPPCRLNGGSALLSRQSRYLFHFSVDSPRPSLLPPASLLRSALPPLLRRCSSISITVSLSCGAVRSEPEDAAGFVSMSSRGADWMSTSQYMVTIYLLSDHVVKATFTMTHSSCSLNSLSSYPRGFSTSIVYVVLPYSYCFASSARIVSSSKCNPKV